VGAQHEAEDLAGTSGRSNGSPAGEVQIYTWRDATLKELSDLVRQVVPEARNTGVRLDFSLVYTDKSGRARSRRCGSISPSASSIKAMPLSHCSRAAGSPATSFLCAF
jgi:histone deacetylase complex subunit SAP18